MPGRPADKEAVRRGIELVRSGKETPETASEVLSDQGFEVSSRTLRRRLAELEEAEQPPTAGEGFEGYRRRIAGWAAASSCCEKLGAVEAFAERLATGKVKLPGFDVPTPRRLAAMIEGLPGPDRDLVAFILEVLEVEPG